MEPARQEIETWPPSFTFFALEFDRDSGANDLPAQHHIGFAANEGEAIELCRAEGFTPFIEGEGGHVDCYDAEDAPGVYGYEADGLGAISVTVYK